MDPATEPVAAPRRRRRWPWILLAVVAAVGMFIAVFDWNWLKGPIERRVTAATGREFEIRGPLRVDLGRHPLVRASDVHLANAAWSDKPEMLALGDVELRIKLLPLLRGRVELPYLRLDRPDLLLERNRKGQGNWIFGDAMRTSATPPARASGGTGVRIHELLVTNGELQVHESTLRTDLTLAVRSAERGPKDARAPLILTGAGTYRGYPFKLDGRIDSPLDLAERARPYDVDVRAAAGDTRAHASGTLPAPLSVDAFAVDFEMSGSNLGDLYQLLGVAVPETPPYRLKGRLARRVDEWRFDQFSGVVGDSDLAGDVSIDVGGKRPMLKGNLVSKRLDFDDLGAAIGAPPSTGAGETASAEQKAQSREQKAGTHVLPDSPFKLDKLRSMDADVSLKATRIDAPRLPMEEMSAHVRLDDGVLSLKPLNFKAAGGTIASRIELDARNPSITTTVTADVRGLELPKLFPKVEITKKGAGTISGAVALTTQGNSIARMAGSANGDIGLIMGPGHISNLLIELAGLDVAESLKYLLDKDREIPVRCAYVDFKVEDGAMGARALAFDTTDTVVYGQGAINLREERLDLRLLPQPKDRSPLSLRVPLRIRGTFKDPSFRPEARPLALRGGAAAALYAIAPPAALLALIETGPGENVDCGPATEASS